MRILRYLGQVYISPTISLFCHIATYLLALPQVQLPKPELTIFLPHIHSPFTKHSPLPLLSVWSFGWLIAFIILFQNYLEFCKRVLIFFNVCVWMLCLNECMSPMCMPGSHGVMDNLKPPCWCWELNLGPLLELPVFLTAEQSNQSWLFKFFKVSECPIYWYTVYWLCSDTTTTSLWLLPEPYLPLNFVIYIYI